MKLNPDFDKENRIESWEILIKKCEEYYSNPEAWPVSPELNPEEIRKEASAFDFSQGIGFDEAVNHVFKGLRKYQVHTSHPAYFGLFNPRSVFPGIAGDLIAGTINPQLAAWSHSPFANEVENYLIREFGKKFGYKESTIDGNFTYGGGESNFTALLCALNMHFPDYATKGLAGIKQKPIFYTSAECHHSFVKAARMAGLGANSLRIISVDEKYRMDLNQLEQAIKDDLHTGFSPFMLASTAGTTGAGVIDPLEGIQVICNKYKLWHHVDAAYGGSGILLPELKTLYHGIEKSDSLIFDAHKWLSVPMAGSLFITKHKEILRQTFRITADYMPKEAEGMEVNDPFTHSLQWSRRFTGLKLYMSLLVFGWDGYKEILQHQVRMGKSLREKLQKTGWKIYNSTKLPVVLFGNPDNESEEFVRSTCNRVLKSGKAWISVYSLQGKPTLRACITNYNTTEEDLDNLVKALNFI